MMFDDSWLSPSMGQQIFAQSHQNDKTKTAVKPAETGNNSEGEDEDDASEGDNDENKSESEAENSEKEDTE